MCFERSRFSLATIHNAGLALRLVGRNGRREKVLEMGLAHQPREPLISLQLAIIAYESRDFARVLELLDEFSDQPEVISLRSEAIAHVREPVGGAGSVGRSLFIKLVEGTPANVAFFRVNFPVKRR